MRNMSFAMTTPQFKARSKDVTRRFGWWFLKPGDKVRAVEKGMGIPKGEKMKMLGLIEIVSVRREPLHNITPQDCVREGFPNMLPGDFVDMLCFHYGCARDAEVNRIEFKHIDQNACPDCKPRCAACFGDPG